MNIFLAIFTTLLFQDQSLLVSNTCEDILDTPWTAGDYGNGSVSDLSLFPMLIIWPSLGPVILKILPSAPNIQMMSRHVRDTLSQNDGEASFSQRRLIKLSESVIIWMDRKCRRVPEVWRPGLRKVIKINKANLWPDYI